MFQMKNLVLEMEITYLKPLFKPILIFEKKKNESGIFIFGLWIFYAIFAHVSVGKYVECAAFAFLC